MVLHKALGTRIDRIIASGRAVLAIVGLIAVWVDPSQPAKFQDFTYTLMAGYTAFALLILGLLMMRPLPSEDMALFTHLIDLTTFSAVMYLTEGSTSPFFVFLTFGLLAATLRWGWRGVIWTAAASLAVLAILGWWAGAVVHDPEFELNRFIIRSVYLTVVSLLLAYLSAHQEQVRLLLARLATHPPPLRGDSPWPIRESLGFAAEILDAKRLLLAWSEPEEPWQQLALWTDGDLEQRSEAPDRYEPLVAVGLARSGFFTLDAAETDAVVVHLGSGGFQRWTGQPVHGALRRDFRIVEVVSVPVPAEGLDARLFLLDRKTYGTDDVQLAELAATRLAALFEQHQLLRRLSLAAASEERLRIARDIHDGVLQFLAGTGLHLQSASALIATDPEGASRRIANLQQTLIMEQAQLRTWVNALRGGSEVKSQVPELAQILGPLVAHLRQQWAIRVSCRIEPSDAVVDGPIVGEITRLIAEAVANARRHGGADAVEIRIELRSDEIRISVSDNGCGCNFQGRFDLPQLQAEGLGPRSLRERVAALGGRLRLESAASGTRLEVELPLTASRTKY